MVDCYLPINFSYGGSSAPATLSFETKHLTTKFNKINPLDDITVTNIYYRANTTYIETVPDYGTCQNVFLRDIVNTTQTCEEQGFNTYNSTNCYTDYTCQIGSHPEEKWKYELRPIKDLGSATLKKDKFYQVCIEGKRTAKLGSYASDIIPKIYSYELSELAWWNTSFSKCKEITINNTQYTSLIDYQLRLNLTYDSDMQSDFDDLRFVNDTCDGAANAVILPQFISRQNNSNWAEVWLKVDSIPANSYRNISVYYGSETAERISNPYLVFLEYSNFTDDTTLNTTLFTKIATSGDPSFSSGTGMIVSNQVWIKSKVNYSTPYVIDMNSTQSTPVSTLYWIGQGLTNWVNLGGGPNRMVHYFTMGTNKYAETYDGAATQTALTNAEMDWQIRSIYYNTSEVNFVFNYTIWKANHTTNIPTTANSTSWVNHLAGTSGGSINVSWWQVRKYAKPEPTYSIGPETGMIKIFIHHPTNKTYNTSAIVFNFTVTSMTYSSFHVKAYNDSATAFYDNPNYANDTELNFPMTKTDGSHYAKVWANDTDGNSNEIIVYYTVDTTPPQVVPQLPAGTYVFNLTQSKTVPLNYTASDVTSSIDKCWYSLDSGSNTSLSGCANTTLSITTVGNHNVKVYANDTLNNIGSASSDFFADFENEFRAKNNDTGALISEFSILFSNSSYQKFKTTTVSLIKANTTELPWTASVTAKYSADGFNDTYEIYNINSTAQLNASANMPPASLTIKTYDEQSLVQLKFNVTIANATTSQTWDSQTNFHQTYASLPQGDVTVTIKNESGGYTQRKYYETITSTSTIVLDAYLLKTAEGWVVRFHIRTGGDQPIVNATVTAKKSINDTLQTVEQAQSDGSGTAVLFLDPSAIYQISAEATGYTTSTYSIQPSLQDYKIFLSSVAEEEFEYIFYDVSCTLRPWRKSLSQNLTTFALQISSNASKLSYYGMNITQVNSSGNFNLFYLQVSDKPAGGNITTSLNLTNTTGNLFVGLWFKHQDYAEFRWNATYYIYSAGGSITGLLTDIGSLLSPMASGIISLLTTMTAAGLASKFTVIGAGIVALAVLGIFTFMGWFSWPIYAIIAIAVVALIFLRSGV